jgi:hypothetical protein
VFFDLPLIGLVLYAQSWALVLGIVALALVIVAIARARKHEPHWSSDLGFGAGAMVVSIVAAGVLGFIVARILHALHAAFALGGSPEWSGVYAAAVTLFAFAIAAAIFAIVRRRISTYGSHLGALLVWALVALLVTISSPGLSFVFTWPALIVAAVVAIGVGSVRHTLTAALLWVATIIALFLLVPTMYLMVGSALGLDAAGAVILAIFTAMATWLLAPHLDAMRGSGWRAASVIAAAAALVLAAIGLLTVRNTAANPAGGSFVYAVDADSGTAWMTGYASTPYSAKWLDRTLNRPNSERQPPMWLARMYGTRRVVPAPMATGPQAAPEVTVLSDTSTSGIRTVTLQVRAAPGTLGVSMASDGGRILSAKVDGIPIDTSRYRSTPPRWSLFYAAPPATGYTLALTMPAFAHPTLDVAARYAGIPSLSGFQLPKRPEGIIPFQWGDITIVYKRVPL